MKSGVDIIAEERKRQLEVEGWKPEGDDQYVDNQLALAGASYAIPEVDREYFGTTEDNVPVMFPILFCLVETLSREQNKGIG